MFTQIQHIEKQLIAVGKQTVFTEQQPITKQGECCTSIIYLPETTILRADEKEVEIKAGTYLNVREFFMHECFKYTLTALHMTRAVVLDTHIIETLKHSNHMFNLFFLKKLSQQLPLTHGTFE